MGVGNKNIHVHAAFLKIVLHDPVAQGFRAGS
jgi:hypothetical protein